MKPSVHVEFSATDVREIVKRHVEQLFTDTLPPGHWEASGGYSSIRVDYEYDEEPVPAETPEAVAPVVAAPCGALTSADEELF
jgi:hypothetical protein